MTLFMARKSVFIVLVIALVLLLLYAVSRIDDRCAIFSGDAWDAGSETVMLIDDDGRPEGMRRLMRVCDRVGAKCYFAVIADRRYNYAFYDSCRRAGYRIVSHSLHHQRYSDPYSSDYDEMKFSGDIDSAKLLLSAIGADSSMFVAPFDCGKTRDSRRIITDRYPLCVAGDFLPIDYYMAPRRCRIPRYWLAKSKGVDDFCRHVDKCRRYNRPIILGVHSYDDCEWDSLYMEKCLKYLMK